MAIAVGVGLLAGASIHQNIKANKAQKRARAEQRAGQKAESAREMREQLREQRIRASQLLQRSEASGTGESSGELGALASLSTNLASNVGMNLGRIQIANNISMFEQDAADALTRASSYQAAANLLGSFGTSSGKPAKKTTPEK